MGVSAWDPPGWEARMRGAEPRTPAAAGPHLGAEGRLFVEIAVHELAVLPGGDLAAGGGGQAVCQGPGPPAGTPAVKAVALCPDPGSGTAPLAPSCSHCGWPRGGRRAPAGSPALGADAAGAALDLAVHVQEAGVVALGLLRADLRGGRQRCVAAGAHPPPFPNRSPPSALTGHSVMSSGQMWAPLEAGSSQVLEAEVRGQNEGLGHPLPEPPPARGPAGAQTTMLSPTVSAPSALGCTWGPGDTRPLTSASGPARTCPSGARCHLAT